MRPTVAIFSALSLGALVLMGVVLWKRIGREPSPEPEVAEVVQPEADAAGTAAAEAPRPGPAPAWVARVKERSRSTPRFDRGVFERVQATESLRQESRKDGFLFRQAGSDDIFVVQKGTRFKIGSSEELQALGFKWEQVKEVPPGTMDHLADRPPDRALLRERGDPRIFFFENGVKRWVSDAGAFNRNGFDWSAVRVTPSGSLGSYATGEPVR
jgi:hypothetical protein